MKKMQAERKQGFSKGKAMNVRLVLVKTGEIVYNKQNAKRRWQYGH
jgi:curli biogenesis system outer membrane secretion channel CsgG